MDIFDGRYFNQNKKFLTLVGLWPFASKSKILVRTIFITSLFLLSVPHLISAILHYNDVDRFMLNMLSFLPIMVMFLKMVALTVTESNMIELYKNVANNWLEIRDDMEQEILVKYSERGRVFTVFYSNFMLTAGTLIGLLPSIPKVLDKVYPLEKPREKLYLMEGEYFVDRDTYFVLIFICDYITSMFVFLTTIVADTMYVVFSEHACSLYAVISYRLRNFTQTVFNKPGTSENDSYNKLVRIIQLHRKAASFTSKLSKGYSMSILFIMAVNIPLIPLNACAIIANLHTKIGILPYLIIFNAITIHLFTIFWPGQRILDHGVSLCDDAYCNEWYATPLRTKKLLLIFMLRCSDPASLNAGGLFLINFETYAMILRTAVSYITVLASFR